MFDRCSNSLRSGSNLYPSIPMRYYTSYRSKSCYDSKNSSLYRKDAFFDMLELSDTKNCTYATLELNVKIINEIIRLIC